MAAKKKSGALARLVESIEIKNPDGSVTMVPVNKEDNDNLNKILASQMRDLITKSIVKFGGMDHLTPKELKELTGAARNVAEFSGEVYKAAQPVDGVGIMRAEPIESEMMDFSKLKDNQAKTIPEQPKSDGNK